MVQACRMARMAVPGLAVAVGVDGVTLPGRLYAAEKVTNRFPGPLLLGPARSWRVHTLSSSYVMRRSVIVRVHRLPPACS
jgi:hypothetical protein